MLVSLLWIQLRCHKAPGDTQPRQVTLTARIRLQGWMFGLFGPPNLAQCACVELRRGPVNIAVQCPNKPGTRRKGSIDWLAGSHWLCRLLGWPWSIARSTNVPRAPSQARRIRRREDHWPEWYQVRREWEVLWNCRVVSAFTGLRSMYSSRVDGTRLTQCTQPPHSSSFPSRPASMIERYVVLSTSSGGDWLLVTRSPGAKDKIP